MARLQSLSKMHEVVH